MRLVFYPRQDPALPHGRFRIRFEGFREVRFNPRGTASRGIRRSPLSVLSLPTRLLPPSPAAAYALTQHTMLGLSSSPSENGRNTGKGPRKSARRAFKAVMRSYKFKLPKYDLPLRLRPVSRAVSG